ncbi:urea amidolyase associated protein UAAP1 [Haloferula chungangensis]|uniref:Urea amidolyase associated protein UAAP1 n=1 Tax=Haloferula chungangensis TaxID=1048331 RepID=A0ABW2L737_9BACT
MNPIFRKTLTGGGMWSAVIAKGRKIRLTDLQGRANVGMLLYNALERQERYNMPDTLKGQYVFYLREPYCLHSDMGRLLASITADSLGWHDTVCGHSDARLVAEKYGEKNYQQAGNGWFRNGRDCFLIELAKWGLGKKDLVPNLNFFSKVVSNDDGELSFIEEHSGPGDFVELRFEMDTLVVLNTCQHPLDTSPVYRENEVKLEVFDGEVAQRNDPSLTVREENLRAWENNFNYHTLRF